MSFRSSLVAYGVSLTLLPLVGAAGTAAQQAPASTQAAPAAIPAQMGLALQNTPVANKIVAGSPAEKAGFRVNDRVLQLDGKAVESSTAFVKGVAAQLQGQAVVVTVLRKGEEVAVRAILDQYDAPPQVVDGKPEVRGRLGLGVTDLVVVSGVTPGGLAEKAGVRRGDRLEWVNSHDTDTVAEATRSLAGALYRGRAELRLHRNGTVVDVVLNLGAPIPYAVTAQDDQAAARHFRPVAEVYREIADDAVTGSGTYTGETEFLSGKVLDYVQDTPKAGQAVYVLSSPGDHVKAGQPAGAVYVLWPDQTAVSRFKKGDTLYLRARVERIKLAEGGDPLTLILTGEEAFASPGAAFNPTRPLLRVTGEAPQDTLPVKEVVKQTQANAAETEAKLKGKSLLYEGIPHRLVRVGQRYSMTFYPDGTPASKNQGSVTLFVQGDVGGALKGFKKGERLRFRGRLVKAAVVVEEVDNFLDGGKKIERTLTVTFEADNLIMDETPL